MGDKFPKSYVVERLEARRESLKSKLDSGRRAFDEWKGSKDPEARAWLVKTRKRLDDLVESIDLQAASIWDEVERVSSILNDRGYAAPSQPQNSWRSDRPAQVQEWLAQQRVWSAEVTKIDHALAYLKELPVTELSITALTKLKLTEAIAFDIRVDPKKVDR